MDVDDEDPYDTQRVSRATSAWKDPCVCDTSRTFSPSATQASVVSDDYPHDQGNSSPSALRAETLRALRANHVASDRTDAELLATCDELLAAGFGFASRGHGAHQLALLVAVLLRIGGASIHAIEREVHQRDAAGLEALRSVLTARLSRPQRPRTAAALTTPSKPISSSEVDATIPPISGSMRRRTIPGEDDRGTIPPVRPALVRPTQPSQGIPDASARDAVVAGMSPQRAPEDGDANPPLAFLKGLISSELALQIENFEVPPIGQPRAAQFSAGAPMVAAVVRVNVAPGVCIEMTTDAAERLRVEHERERTLASLRDALNALYAR